LFLLDDLPPEAEYTLKPRGEGEYLVNVVKGIPLAVTKRVVIVAGPLGDSGEHGFYTIFPGENAPPFPDDRPGNWQSPDQVKEFQAFWQKHGLVEEYDK